MKKLINSAVSRRAFLGGAAALGALGLAACSGDDQPAGDDPQGDATGTEGGGTITAGSAYAATNFNPATTSSALSLGTNWHVVEGLYGIDYHDYTTFPELATGDPEWIDDNTCEVTLREGAKFSDGTEVTPEDVIESFARANAEGNIYVPMLAPITSIEKKDDTTLTIKTSVANFSLIKERLAIIRVVPASSNPDDMTAKPIGSGPWKYDEITEASVDLSPNENYNGSFPAKDSKLHYDILVDATARVTAQQEGTTLAMEMVTADAIDQLEAAGCKVDTVQGFATRFIMFDIAKAPWDNVKARQAVMYALNYDQMISNAFAGLAAVPSCYLPNDPAFPNYHEASTVYSYDPDKAKQLLDEAGIDPASLGEIELCTTDNEQVEAMATQVQQDLTALGFSVKINSQTSQGIYAYIDAAENTYDMLLAPGDPSCFGADPDLLMNWWFGDSVWMRTRCPWMESEEWKHLQELMSTALAQTGDEQQQTWNECFDILAEQCVLYPVLHVQTATGYWADPASAPQGVALEGFSGIGTTGMSFVGANTVSA